MKRIILLLTLLMLLIPAATALSESSLTLPTSLKEIGSKCFYENSAIRVVTIQKSTTSIGELAFAKSGLTNITIPDSVTFIADNAFDGLAAAPIFNVMADSYAYQWCIDHGYTPKIYSDLHSRLVETVIAVAKAQIGKPYVSSGHSPNVGFDCSGLCYYVYNEQLKALLKNEFPNFNFKTISNYVPFNSTSISKTSAQTITKIEDLEPGDIVCFDTNGGSTKVCNHVGIYIGDNCFIHASGGSNSSSGKVVLTDFYKSNYKYYVGVFMFGKRVLP